MFWYIQMLNYHSLINTRRAKLSFRKYKIYFVKDTICIVNTMATQNQATQQITILTAILLI